jgi:hypothetical protein
MANHTVLQAENKEGEHLSVQHTSTDSPILPAANMRELQEIDSKLVPFVIEQTSLEADFRRTETKRVNTLVFIERISGVVFGALIALFVEGLGSYLILRGHDWAGAIICGSALASIVGIFVTKKMTDNKSDDDEVKPEPRAPKPRPKKR